MDRIWNLFTGSSDQYCAPVGTQPRTCRDANCKDTNCKPGIGGDGKSSISLARETRTEEEKAAKREERETARAERRSGKND